ncbi:O-antigen ligase family protein [Sphingopyxis sp.]|uniref:O-antigen ligase family protein n=1 Tax=Sphingopyxis sp. TaxID=1908224 RepID=UPI003D0A1F33
MHSAARTRLASRGGATGGKGTPAYILLLGLGFLFLPFTKALTVDIGFPLKIYELLFAAALPTFLLSRHPVHLKQKWPLLRPLIFAWLVAVGSFFAFSYADVGHLGMDFRGGATLDGLARVAYLLLNLGIFFVIIARPSLSASSFLVNCWLIGCAISVSYSVYCVFSYLIFGEAFLLPGLERHQLGNLGPILVSRSGTFEEGNFGGLYFLVSAALALHLRRPIFAAIAIVGLILTQSTAAYFGLIMLVGAYYLLANRNLFALIPYFVAACVAAFGLFVYFAEQGKFEATGSASGAVRFNEAMTGINIWLTSPIYGVGLGQYGFHYFRNVWDMSLAEAVTSERHIAAVVYVEILSELGILGLLAFALFWTRWARAIKVGHRNGNILYASTFAILVSFLAYPTFNIAFIWCYFGMALVLVHYHIDGSRIADVGLSKNRARLN